MQTPQQIFDNSFAAAVTTDMFLTSLSFLFHLSFYPMEGVLDVLAFLETAPRPLSVIRVRTKSSLQPANRLFTC